jgi:predicted DNA-binding transcriptional regulator AlpA
MSDTTVEIAPHPELGIEPAPVLVGPARAAAMLGVSKSMLWKLEALAQIPAPRRLGSKVTVWAVAELRAWAAAGCPRRDLWESLKQKQGQ